MTPKEIKALAKVMHSCGIVSLKTPEIELLVQPRPVSKRVRKSKISDDSLPKGDFRGYTEEQILSWSAPMGEDS